MPKLRAEITTPVGWNGRVVASPTGRSVTKHATPSPGPYAVDSPADNDIDLDDTIILDFTILFETSIMIRGVD